MLSSWKEIAHFFGKGVRTVQRWEKTLNLPIRRPPGAPSNVVLARTSDLEAWMHRGLGKAAMEEASSTADQDIPVLVAQLETELSNLVVRLGGKPLVLLTDAPISRRMEELVEQMRTVDVVEEPTEHRLRKVA